MSYNMMIGYDIYDCFTMKHFGLPKNDLDEQALAFKHSYVNKMLSKTLIQGVR
jgi:hypothetical protein